MPREHRHHKFHRPSPVQPTASFGAPRKLSAPIHSLEKALLTVVSIHLVFLPWAFGSTRVWSQTISFGLSLLSFGLALRPRYYSAEFTDGHPFHLRTLPKLLRFPIFWIGLLFLLYILIQALNPAWEYVTNGRSWWLQGVSCIDWLPTGMRTPFAQASPWRSMMVYSSAWMTACAVWIGFTRRRTLRLLLIVLSISGALLALVGLAQRALGATEILGLWRPSNADFAATFINRNHGAAYLNLILAVSAALAFWYYRRQLRRGEQSSPALVFGFFALLIALMVLYSYSRGGGLVMIGFLAAAVGLVGRRLLFSADRGQSPLVAIVIGLLVVAFVGYGLYSLKTDQIERRLRDISKDMKSGREYPRWVTANATWEMAQDQLITGWGAGSYRFYFPVYQVRYPQILTDPDTHKRLLWEHAHDDYLELLAETGAIGCSILVAGLLYYLIQIADLRIWRHPPATLLVLGCVATAIHATVDFPFFCPAILITWCALWAVLIKWAELELQNREGG
jgi:O-antigen ligase